MSFLHEKDIKYQVSSLYSVSDPQFKQAMGTLLGPSFVEGNEALTLINGDEIFPAMLGAIRTARRTITFETHVFKESGISRDFADALAERARAGVKVHVILDAYGADAGGEKLMRETGVELEIYRPLRVWKLREYNHRTHRKLLVVDGRIGFTGGVGIDDVWKGDAASPEQWRDTHFKVRGPIVAQMQAVFMDNWLKTRGELLHGADYFPVLKNAGSYRAQIFPSSPSHGGINAYLMYLLAINSAQKSILIESAYFVPDDMTLDALAKAARRGVNVEIILPGKHIDRKMVNHGSRPLWGTLLAAGVKIYLYDKTMLHAKLTIADDLFCSVGSSNFDHRSFKLNDEGNLNVLDRKFALEQRRIFEADKAVSRPITLEEWNDRSTGTRIKEMGARIFAPLL